MRLTLDCHTDSSIKGNLLPKRFACLLRAVLVPGAALTSHHTDRSKCAAATLSECLRATRIFNPDVDPGVD
jgi:hypothetical protein